jgi:hypothetical protein
LEKVYLNCKFIHFEVFCRQYKVTIISKRSRAGKRFEKDFGKNQAGIRYSNKEGRQLRAEMQKAVRKWLIPRGRLILPDGNVSFHTKMQHYQPEMQHYQPEMQKSTRKCKNPDGNGI